MSGVVSGGGGAGGGGGGGTGRYKLLADRLQRRRCAAGPEVCEGRERALWWLGGRTVTACRWKRLEKAATRERERGGGGRHKRHARVYDIHPSTTAVFSYAIGP